MKRLFFLPLVLATLFSVSCREDQPSHDAAAGSSPEVDVLSVKPEDAVISTRIPGRMEPYLQAEVRARATGIILDRCYQEGQKVKEGDVLFRIDPAPLQAVVDACKADISRSEAVLKDARDKLEKYGNLVGKGSVSKREYNMALAGVEQSQAEFNAAKARLEQSMQELGYTTVTAPIGGRVRRALVTKGALANKNELTHLTTVEQINPIFVRFSAPSSELSELKRSIVSGNYEGISFEQTRVRLILPDGREYPIEGKFIFSDLSVDPETDSVEMRAEFPNPDMELLPGAYVRIVFDTAIQRNIYRVPRDAVVRSGEGAAVYVVGSDNMLESRPVEAERLEGRNWIVTKGLEKGERIVVSKLSRLMPGMPVRISGQAGEAIAPGLRSDAAQAH